MTKVRVLFWVNAIFYIVFWWIMLFQPDLALTTIVIAFWIESLLSGIAWAVFALQDTEFEERGLLGAISIFQILVWIFLMFFPSVGEVILRIFIVLLWIWAIIKGIALIIDSFDFKAEGYSKWWWILIGGCLLFLLWIFLATNSLLALLIFNSLIGFWLVIAGIGMVIWALQIRKDIKKMKNIEKQVEEALENWESVEIEITRSRIR